MKLHVLMEEGNETTSYSWRKVMKLHVLMEEGNKTTCTHRGR